MLVNDSYTSFQRYYTKSKRVSVVSSLTTNSNENTIRLLLIAPPNHPEKMNEAIKIVTKNITRSKRIRFQIERDGLTVDSVWENYGI